MDRKAISEYSIAVSFLDSVSHNVSSCLRPETAHFPLHVVQYPSWDLINTGFIYIGVKMIVKLGRKQVADLGRF